MAHPRSDSTTTRVVAILGATYLVEGILSRLLEEEGYHVRHLKPYPTGRVDALLDGVDVVLLASGLKDGVREAFLETMRSTQETAALPVLPLSDDFKLALLDELSAGASWRTLFEDLVGQIESALQRAAEPSPAAVQAEAAL